MFSNDRYQDSPRLTPPSSPTTREFLDRIYAVERERRTLCEHEFLKGRSEGLVEALQELGEGPWDEYEGVEIPPEYLGSIAKQLFTSSAPARGETVVIVCTRDTSPLAAEVLRLCEENGVTARLELTNYARDAVFSSFLTNESRQGELPELQRYGGFKFEVRHGKPLKAFYIRGIFAACY